MNQDTTSGDYDFPARYYSTQGRWPSPDPAGLAAVDPTNPQSWNRYAYVLNNPLSAIDPSGLDCVYAPDASDNPFPHADGTATIIPGDCINAGGKDDSGVFVDNDPNHPVQQSDVVGGNGTWLISYTKTNGLTTGYACLGDCPSDSVQVTMGPPDEIPTVSTIGPDPNWFHSNQARCIVPGLKGLMGGLVMKKSIDAALSPVLGPPPREMDGPAALGTASVAAHVGLDRVAENRPLLNTVKAALKEEGHKVSANALGRGAKFAGKVAFGAHIGFAMYEGWEDYQTCIH